MDAPPPGTGRRRTAGLVLTDAADDLPGLGEAVALGKLAKDQLAVEFDVEDAPAAGDEFRLQAQRLLKLGGQTGRLRQVVSLLAVGDAEGGGHVGTIAAKTRPLPVVLVGPGEAEVLEAETVRAAGPTP